MSAATAPLCCWWSRMPIWRFRSPTADMCWKRGNSSFTASQRRCGITRTSGPLIWADGGRRQEDKFLALLTRSSLLRPVEILQIRRRLIFAGRHQQAIGAEEVVVLADHHMRIVLAADPLAPDRLRIGIAQIVFRHRPRARQSMVNGGDFVVQDARIGFVDVDALLEHALIVLVQRQAACVIGARALEAAAFDFEHVVAAVAVLIDPFADRISDPARLDLPGPLASVRVDAAALLHMLD